jgi:hypothetical protein
LHERRRFIDRDLNRQWMPEQVEALLSGKSPESPVSEDEEQRQLLVELQTELGRVHAGAYF